MSFLLLGHDDIVFLDEDYALEPGVVAEAERLRIGRDGMVYGGDGRVLSGADGDLRPGIVGTEVREGGDGARVEHITGGDEDEGGLLAAEDEVRNPKVAAAGVATVTEPTEETSEHFDGGELNMPGAFAKDEEDMEDVARP